MNRLLAPKSKRRSLRAMPLPVRRSLKLLGEDLKIARKVRRLTMADICARALISRTTLAKAERGDPAVTAGTYATIMFCLGLGTPLDTLLELSRDGGALNTVIADLPKRVRRPGTGKKPRKTNDIT